MDKLYLELLEAARDMLNFGYHEGKCDNQEEPEEICTLHIQASRKRTKQLNEAIDNIDNFLREKR